MENYTPVILDQQKKIIKWAKGLRGKHISFATIIEYLVSNNKTGSDIISNGLNEVRELYNKYNGAWREQVLKALMLEEYRLQNDIKEGQIVTNGELVGFAYDVDYKTRTFDLHSSRDVSHENFIASFEMDEFSKV